MSSTARPYWSGRTDIRIAAGLLAFHVIVLGLGLSFLLATGLLSRRRSEVLLGLSAAHLVGVALAVLATTLALIIGLRLSVPGLAAGWLVLTGVLAAVAWRRRPTASPSRPNFDGSWVLGGLLLLAAAVFLAAHAVASDDVAPGWDAAHIWTFKAAMLVHFDGLDPGIFAADAFAGAHLDYPLVHPVLGAVVFRFAGNAQQGILVAEVWVLLAALLGTVVFLLRHARHGWVALLPVGVAVLAPTTFGLLRGDAEMTMAAFLGAGVLALALGVEGNRAALPAAVLFLGAAANTKNEGLVFAVVAVAVALVVALVRSRRAGTALALVAVGVAALVVPWRLWIRAHGPFASDVTPLGTSLSPSFLVDHLPSLEFAAETLVALFARQGDYGWVIPAFLALGITSLFAAPVRALAAFYLATALLVLAALLWVYWTSLQPDVAGHILRTSVRTITAPLFVAAVGTAHLLARSLEVRAPLRAATGAHPDR